MIFCGLVVINLSISRASHVIQAPNVVQGPNVKVTLDNNNVDGLVPTPSFDARNRDQEETSIAISPVNSNVVASGSMDGRLAGTSWIEVNTSRDGGGTWFNTTIPGFSSDTSAAGLASPLKGRAFSADPAVRFDATGNL